MFLWVLDILQRNGGWFGKFLVRNGTLVSVCQKGAPACFVGVNQPKGASSSQAPSHFLSWEDDTLPLHRDLQGFPT